MGDGDAWPAIRRQMLAADVQLIATPTWMGQHSSVCLRVLERLAAELSEKDGAHHITADVFQALKDVGFTVPTAATTYWHGAATEKTDFLDLPSVPENTAKTTKALVANAFHLAQLLKAANYQA